MGLLVSVGIAITLLPTEPHSDVNQETTLQDLTDQLQDVKQPTTPHDQKALLSDSRFGLVLPSPQYKPNRSS